MKPISCSFGAPSAISACGLTSIAIATAIDALRWLREDVYILETLAGLEAAVMWCPPSNWRIYSDDLVYSDFEGRDGCCKFTWPTMVTQTQGHNCLSMTMTNQTKKRHTNVHIWGVVYDSLRTGINVVRTKYLNEVGSVRCSCSFIL